MNSSTLARSSFVLVLVGAFLFGGCASIGLPPTEFDLANDGSPDKQAALHRNYAVTYEGGAIARPGAGLGALNQDLGEATVYSPAPSEAANTYLSSSAPAAAALDTTAIAVDRFAGSGSAVLLVELTPAAIGAGVGIVSALAAEGKLEDRAVGALGAGVLGAAAGAVVGVPLATLYALFVPAITGVFAESDYRAATKAFNDDLTVRIRAAARPAAAAPAPASSAPASPASDDDRAPPSGN